MSFNTIQSRIKPVFKCLEEYKSQFKDSTCLLTISVGQEVHEGEKFISTLALVNDSFKACTILVDDSLQRHTMAIQQNMKPEELYDKSITEGNLWIERNKPYVSRMTIPINMIRWDKWLKHEMYEITKSQILNEYETDMKYKEALDSTIEAFLSRYYSRLENINHLNLDLITQYCLDYLIEECTALCLWVEGDYNFEVYPAKRSLAMSETHRKFIVEKYPNRLNPVAIKFKNRKQLKPQNFNLKEEFVA